jgi:hypothetical protein
MEEAFTLAGVDPRQPFLSDEHMHQCEYGVQQVYAIRQFARQQFEGTGSCSSSVMGHTRSGAKALCTFGSSRSLMQAFGRAR